MNLSFETFESLEGSSFSVALEGGAAMAELVEVKKLSPPNRPIGDAPLRSQPFALLFKFAPSVVLHQAIYSFNHTDSAESVALFIVPVAADAEGRYYEAVFT